MTFPEVTVPGSETKPFDETVKGLAKSFFDTDLDESGMAHAYLCDAEGHGTMMTFLPGVHPSQYPGMVKGAIAKMRKEHGFVATKLSLITESWHLELGPDEKPPEDFSKDPRAKEVYMLIIEEIGKKPRMLRAEIVRGATERSYGPWVDAADEHDGAEAELGGRQIGILWDATDAANVSTAEYEETAGA